MSDVDWTIPRPQRWVKAVRTDDGGTEHLAFVGYVAKVAPDGKGSLGVTTNGPEGLLLERPLSFAPPMVELGESAEAFAFFWRQLDYVFELPDPLAFPPLSTTLDARDREVVARYISVAEDLAASGVVNAADAGVFVDIEDHTNIEHVAAEFGERDRQTGFAVLLRQCDSKEEPVSFARVADLLWQAADETHDHQRQDRLDTLAAWRKAAGRLHGKSLNQLLRDKLVADEGMAVLAYAEPNAPSYLLSAFDYGDLVHWGKKRSVVASWDEGEFSAGDRRRAFFDAAMALTHLYIGFAELARAALDARN